MTNYEITLDGNLVDSSDLSGVALLKYESACLLGEASLVRVVNTGDPVLDGRYKYDADGGWTYVGASCPPCPCGGKHCKYMRKPADLPLQKNALRIEIITPAYKCGWYLKPGHIGGCDQDYYECKR